MVKFTAAVVAALAVFAPIAEAKTCKTSLSYCGYVLLRRGNYYNQIDQALKNAHQPTDNNHFNNALFYCRGGADGDIEFRQYCKGGCHDGGNSHSDSC